MALKATIYKANLNIADMDRDYYASHNLTVACHPSETERRLMARIVAFAMFASEGLRFTRGLSTDEEPDIWEKDLTDHVEHWIELGLPDETRVRKGCQRATKMTVVVYGDRAGAVWWDKNSNRLQRFRNLQVWFLPDEKIDALAALVARTMDFQFSIQDGQMWITVNGTSLEITPQQWK